MIENEVENFKKKDRVVRPSSKTEFKKFKSTSALLPKLGYHTEV